MSESLAETLRKAAAEFASASLPFRKAHARRSQRAVKDRFRPAMRRAAKEWLASLRSFIAAADPGAEGGEGGLDWEAIDETTYRIFGKVVLDIIQASGIRLSAGQRNRALSKARSDPIGEASVRWARRNTGRLVRDINEKTREGIRRIIARGIDRGLSAGDIKRELRDLVGLREDQLQAIENKYLRDRAAGLTEREARALGGAYADDLLNDRLDLIAQTETAEAASAGTLAAYEEHGIEEVEWVADMGPGCCEECQENNGQTFSIEEAEEMLPAHPGCECVWVTATPGGRG